MDNLWIIGVLATIVAVGVLVWMVRRPAKSEQPLHAIVWLLDAPRAINEAAVRRIVKRALGVTLGQDDVVQGFKSSYAVRLGDVVLLIISEDEPYSDLQQIETIPDIRLRGVVERHRAWVSVDLVQKATAPTEAMLTEAYPYIGKIAAAMADDDCLALYATGLPQMLPHEPALVEALRHDDPRKTIADYAYVPVIQIDGDDARMKEAVNEARRRWPAFVEAFEEAQPTQNYNAKAPLGDPVEYMWVEVTAIEGNTVRGKLANEPANNPQMKLGDLVSFDVRQLNDWLIVDGDELRGGFTIEVVGDAETNRSVDGVR